MRNVHYRNCNICEAMCGVAIEHDGKKVLSLRGDDQDPFSRGYICPKATALGDIHADPDRLRQPQKRVGKQWQDCSWDEALDTSARRLVEIQGQHSRHAVGVYVGNPTVHNFGSTVFALMLLEGIGSFNRFSATSVDQLPHMLAGLEMFGHQLMMPVPDIDRSQLFVVFGANPLVSNGSIMSAPGMKHRLAALKRRGGKLIVVDPRRSETAKFADEHHFIRPGADVFVLAAMVRTLFEEERVRLGRLAGNVDGLQKLKRAVDAFVPERAAKASGIPADTIRALARQLAQTERAVLYGRMGVCTQRFGGLNAWLVNALNLLCGNLDEVGGSMFTTPAVDILRATSLMGQRGHFDKGRSRVRGLPEFNGEYPAATLAEEILTPGERQIRGMVTLAGNPVLSVPEGHRVAEALESLEFMVSIDIYRNETTRHADFILPPTSALEQSHYDLALNCFAVRNVAKYSPALFQPAADAKHDWQIQLELASRIEHYRSKGLLGGIRKRTVNGLRSVVAGLGPEGVLRAGFAASGRRVSIAKLKKKPHGIDLGPLESRLPERLFTADKNIRLAPARLLQDLPRAETSMDEVVPPLLLIGRRQLRTNNSWLHNSMRMAKGRDRCTLIMHPDDARARELAHGDRVRVRGRNGNVVVSLHIQEDIMPGVVSLPHGFGHDLPGVQLGVAKKHAPGVNINRLTDNLLVDELTGTAAVNGVPVEVEPSNVVEQSGQASAGPS